MTSVGKIYLVTGIMQSGPIVPFELMFAVGGNAYEAWLIAYMHWAVIHTTDNSPWVFHEDGTAWIIDDGLWSTLTGIHIDKISEAVTSLLKKKYILLQEFEVEGSEQKKNGFALNWEFLVDEIAKHCRDSEI